MNRNVFLQLTILLTLFLLQPAAMADTSVGVVFSKDEVSIIAAWYKDHDVQKRGKQKGGLPPGIARNLQRGKALPPGIAMQQLPQGLVHELPAPHAGYERVIVDGKILLVEIATRIIHDVLTEAVLN
jgi:Ni/Co efflux regulator RcnB